MIQKILTVTPLVGVWIEIICTLHHFHNRKSLPLWECGLKSFQAVETHYMSMSHSPCGSVD